MSKSLIRAGGPVQKLSKETFTMVLKITDYADNLLKALDKMSGWPESKNNAKGGLEILWL